MRKQTHFKKVVSFALAAAMAVSVCTAALADEATTEATKEASASEQVETQSDGETENDIDALTTEEGGRPIGLAAEGETQVASNVAQIGDNQYSSFGDAFLAANSGDTITLLDDAEVSGTLSLSDGRDITVDLNGHNIVMVNASNRIQVNHGKLTLIGSGKLYEASPYFAPIIVKGSQDEVNDYSVVNVGKDVTLTGWAGVFIDQNKTDKDKTVAANGVVVNIEGTLESVQDTSGDYGQAIYVNGSVAQANDNYAPIVNVKSTAKLTATYDETNGGGLGMYIAGYTLVTVENGATIEGSTGIEIRAGKLIVNGGSIKGGAKNLSVESNGSGSTTQGAGIAVAQHTTHLPLEVTVNDGVISGSAALNEANPQQNPADKISLVKLTVKGGTFTGAFNSEDVKNFVSGGTFNTKVDIAYLADGYTLKDNGNGTYTVGEKTVDTKPAEPEKTEVSDNAESKVEVKKEDNITASEVVEAAKSTEIVSKDDATTDKISQEVTNSATVTVKGKDVAIGSTEAAEAAKGAISAAATDSSKNFDPDAENKDITIVAVPKLVVEPKAAANNDTDVSMTFDIKMLYDVKATVADDVKNMTETNTVTLEKNKEMPAEQVPTVAISLDVSALKIPEGQKVFVRHVKEDGTVYYYEAETKTENGIVKTITFVNPDGFSEFTVMANKSVTVTIDGKEYALSAADIGKGFEIAKKDYCDWKGVSFKGIEGVYTTLTKELYDKAANGQKLEGTNVFEQVWFPPEEPTPAPTAAPTATPAPVEAAPAATAAPTATPAPTPDNSQYYTCVACGHHNWTATADGYKCDTCGHLETKQISGYKNVKGTYAPTASSAKTAAATASTIPQTSDEMPIVPIAIIAIAALLGLGVTAYMKKKQH